VRGSADRRSRQTRSFVVVVLLLLRGESPGILFEFIPGSVKTHSQRSEDRAPVLRLFSNGTSSFRGCVRDQGAVRYGIQAHPEKKAGFIPRLGLGAFVAALLLFGCIASFFRWCSWVGETALLKIGGQGSCLAALLFSEMLVHRFGDAFEIRVRCGAEYKPI